MKKTIKSWVPKLLAIALVITALGVQNSTAYAASVTRFSDNLSDLTQGALSNHEIQFNSPSGIAAGQTVTFTFANFTTVTSIVFTDVDFATSNAACQSSPTFTEQTLAASPSGTTWGAATATTVLTITSGTGTATAGNCIRVRIGTNAVTGVTGSNRITNPASPGTDTVVIGGTFGDTGTADIAVITNSQVAVTATVTPSITFSLSANSIQFGNLDAADDRYATTSGGSSAVTSAHTLSAGTNASSGYIMYVRGATLTNGALDTITAPAGPSATTIGSEQFGLNLSASGGSGTVDSQYGTSSQYGWGATATTEDNVASATGATASTTYTATYVANIGASTEAGAYATTLTYTATASF